MRYLNPVQAGLDAVRDVGDGSTINLTWFEAFSDNLSTRIAYHIYYSTEKETVFSEGVKYIVIDGSLSADIPNLIPGQLYFFSIRPVEYFYQLVNSNQILLYNNQNLVLIISNIDVQLPLISGNLRVYPSSLLRSDITASDLIIPLVDIEGFPNIGIVKIGVELIQYSSLDVVNNNLVLTNLNQRGYAGTTTLSHTVDGYDGYNVWNNSVSIFIDGEDSRFDRIFMCQCRFEYPNFPFTQTDGYHQVLKDNLNTDLSFSDEQNVNFPSYTYSGYHRVDPVQLLNGVCVGSYIGGERLCIDQYGNINSNRGLDLQDSNNQREEELLTITGRPAVLIKRVWTGITCTCYLAASEYPDDRCPFCLGSGFLIGYQQYFNPRRSDGRILVRTSPADDGVKMYEAGYESELNLDLWTLTVPTIHQRDIIVLFQTDNETEEFRYEVGTVTRNNTIVGMQGGQKFRSIRIRKTDPAYQIRVFRDTSMFPSTINTTISSVPGYLPAHQHTIVRNEHDPSTWSQITSISQGHSHTVRIENGVPIVMETLSHTHNIIIL